MMEKQITNHGNSLDKSIPASRSFPNPTFYPISEEGNDWNFKQFLDILQRRAIIIIGVVSVGMAGVTYSTLNQKSIYEGNFQILVEPVNNDNDLGKLVLDSGSMTSDKLDYESQIQVLKSPELLRPVVKKIQESYPDINYTTLLGNLIIRRLGTAKVIEVSYKNHDTKKINLVLETISNFYLKYSLNKRQTKLRQGVEFVNRELPKIQNRVAQTQKELQLFRQKYNFIDPESQSKLISDQIQGLREQRLSINQQLTSAKFNYLSLQGATGQLSAINNSSLYQQLITQQRQLDTQISGELARFNPDNPVVKTLQEKRNNLLPLIEEEAKRSLTIKVAEAANLVSKVEADNQQLSQAEQKLQNTLAQLPLLSRQYTDIQRNLQIANESLTRFLSTREQLQIQVAQTELPWELIQAPNHSEYPISPNIRRNLLLGFVASFLLGLGAAKILEEMDNTYHTIESIQEKIKIPIIGTLPFDKSSVDPLLNSNNRVSDGKIVLADIPQDTDKPSHIFGRQKGYYGQGEFWESLQVLYSNIQLLNSDRPINSLVISSPMPGDGKSTIAFNLAKIATAMGKRVLLVDADLRRPQIHKLSELDNLSGLSNLISSNMGVEKLIREVPAIKNLSVITSGPIPPDSVRLLSSDRMKQLMEHFSQSFDLVIYDCPPMLGLVDARLIAANADGMMLVMRMNKTDKSALVKVQDSLRTYPINLLGLVVNGDTSQSSYYYNSYSQYFNRGKVSNN